MTEKSTAFLTTHGYCPCCPGDACFESSNSWLRDHYFCKACGSIPRERALMWCLDHYYPNWPALRIHESSPVMRGASARLARECPQYLPTQFFPGIPPGAAHRGCRCETLEKLTFADGSIDIHVTQDVMEHVFDPASAFREIARTLCPGGAHVFTTPLVEKNSPSRVCATLNEHGEIVHLREPEYHGNPVSADGALVTRRWGYDIADFIAANSGLHTAIVHLEIPDQGIQAEYIEVLISRKPI